MGRKWTRRERERERERERLLFCLGFTSYAASLNKKQKKRICSSNSRRGRERERERERKRKNWKRILISGHKEVFVLVFLPFLLLLIKKKSFPFLDHLSCSLLLLLLHHHHFLLLPSCTATSAVLVCVQKVGGGENWILFVQKISPQNQNLTPPPPFFFLIVKNLLSSFFLADLKNVVYVRGVRGYFLRGFFYFLQESKTRASLRSRRVSCRSNSASSHEHRSVLLPMTRYIYIYIYCVCKKKRKQMQRVLWLTFCNEKNLLSSLPCSVKKQWRILGFLSSKIIIIKITYSLFLATPAYHSFVASIAYFLSIYDINKWPTGAKRMISRCKTMISRCKRLISRC